MDWWQAIVLGIVEGVTEYLPISSTGHLILTQRAMGIAGGDAADAYAICIQSGAILAVLGLYYRHVKQMTLGVLGKEAQGFRMATNTVVAFLPAAVIGLLLNDVIKGYLFGMWPVVGAWFVGGVAILAVAWRRKARGETSDGFDLDQLTWRMALVIGFAQCLAMWPGTSRSLVTIVAGVLVGMRLAAAVEFSFLLGVVTLGAATCHDAYKHHDAMLTAYDPGTLVLGGLFAFVSAVIAVKWMVAYLNKHGLALFGYYRVVLAAAVAFLIITGQIVDGAG